MKLKLVVATMSVLGLVSSPAFAAHKHKHQQKVSQQEVVTERNYKDFKDALPMEAACTISQPTMIMDQMTQSMNRSMPNPCNPGWFNRIHVSGGINVDLGKFGNRNGNYMGENYQRFSLNDAYLNIGADVNDWTKAFASISYNTATINDPNGPTSTTGYHVGEYSAAYSNNVLSGSTSSLQLEQAYATFANFNVSPIFLQLGKQFQDFGRYEIHPITRSMTQVMSETLATSIKVGFIANGFHGSIYAFDNPIAKVGQTSKPTNYGAALGYDRPSDQLGFDIGAAYLYNMMGVNDVAYEVNQFNTHNTALNTNGVTGLQGYNSRVGALALYADVNSGPFVLGARYTTATSTFSPNDLPKNGIAALNLAANGGLAPFTQGSPVVNASGARPWAAGLQAGFGFEGWSRNQNIYLGYQWSREAAGLNLPKSRWALGYGIDAFGKNTNVGIEWDHDQAYSTSQGGIPSNNTNLVTLRAGVQFS